ncbi:hypothetical protein N431DRAFT_494579 [Stipitochalara longipes BDJ]|nr:hypothetical protein N431DRAFT_494579 [Stipitochalara longipes BDJ]
MASNDAKPQGHTSSLIIPTFHPLGSTDAAHSRDKRVERVFPIRIHIPIRQPPKENQTLPKDDGIGVKDLGSTSDGLTRPEDLSLPSMQDSSAPSIFTIEASEGHSSSNRRYVTNKFNYVPCGDGSSNKPFIAGQKIYRCEDEPIHIPGAIQRFGALVAVREEGGIFVVRVVSENSHSVTGLDPEALFQLRCFTDILTPPHRHDFIIRAHVLHTEPPRANPDVFSMSLTPVLGGPEIPVFCAMHLNTDANLIVCELELDQIIISDPERLPGGGFPHEPIQIIYNEATDAERLQSTTSKSKPLHSLQIARTTARKLTLMDLFQILAEIQTQISSATNLSNLGDVLVGLVHDLTSFHRVMVYQFDDTGAGSVVSELIDPRASKDLYRGLHFPASDIPKQAQTARLLCRNFDDAKMPLDLKYSYLRSMSPIHLKYLANMMVQASMSISLVVDNKLWGLVSCHNYGSGSGIHISLPMREICRGLGNIASNNIQKLLYSSRINARRPLVNAPPTASPFSYITSSTSDLLNMFGADFGFLVIRGEARTIGKLVAYKEAIVLLRYIRQQARTTIWYSHAISTEFPDLNYASSFLIISGMLVVPLTLSGTDFLVFFRKGKVKEIKWAGNPYEEKVAAGTEYLEPRSSFKRWSENVVGTSREWTEDEVESAAILTTLYGRFIEVWRQKEAVVQQNRMTRLLIRNAGHEVRTPLNSIINYLEAALEETLDEPARLHLQQSLQASKSLVFVVNDLLNLTEAEGGALQIHEENVDLRGLLSEVAAAFREEAARRNCSINIEDDPAVPHQVRCDSPGLRQVVSNLLANALQNSEGGQINVGLKHIQTTQMNSMIMISLMDNGRGLSEEHLDRIFQDFEQILDDEESSVSAQQASIENPTRPVQIGLGLATAARFVRLHSGTISMSSEGEDKGMSVAITVPFRKALPGESPSSPSSPGSAVGRYPFPLASSVDERPKFNVLIAEDNPLNSRLLETRLTRRGHTVRVTVEGQACVNTFKNTSRGFDIILMDIQMPLVDGIEATRMIRKFEQKPNAELDLSPRIATYGRIPIIAVSASLSEEYVQEYIDSGFDGWITKPIDFERLEAIIVAIEDEQMREVLFYGAGNWNRGGWFKVRGEKGGLRING